MTPKNCLKNTQTKSYSLKMMMLMMMMRNSSVDMQLLLRFRFLGSLARWIFQSEQYCTLTLSCKTRPPFIIYLHYLSSCDFLTVKRTDQAYAKLMKV